jgi:hypothetical protein
MPRALALLQNAEIPLLSFCSYLSLLPGLAIAMKPKRPDFFQPSITMYERAARELNVMKSSSCLIMTLLLVPSAGQV